MTAALVLAPLVPMAAALVIAAWPSRRRDGFGWIVVAATLTAAALLLAAGTREVAAGAMWMRAGSLVVTVALRLDPLSRFVALLVCGVAAAVQVYAVGYMRSEEGSRRFFGALAFFTGAMLTLVLADSLLLLFAAWEAVGFASWLLIGHRRRQADAARASILAFVTTRIADLVFLLGWLTLFLVARTTDLRAIISLIAATPSLAPVAATAALLIAVGALGKSAQLPFSAWLPGAMAAPTPVSALLHSATMVAAGVYVLIRLFPLYAAAPVVLDGLLWIGLSSAAVAAVIATGEMDLKRLLAWSTIAQLGEMVIGVGFGAPRAALFHLTAHAAFKAALFLCAGAIEHATGTRRLDSLGGLRRRMPVTAACFAAAGLALAAVPPFSGFFSEDAIVAAAAARGAWWVAALAALVWLSGMYIGRAWFSVFGGTRAAAARSADPPALWLWPIVVLTGTAAALGAVRSVLPALGEPNGGAGAPRVSTFAVTGASLAGLALSAWQVRRAGVAPAFGILTQRAAALVSALPGALVRPVPGIAALTGPIERTLDAAARSASAAAMRAARGTSVIEDAANAAARLVARSALAAAGWTDAAETGAFGAGGDRLASGAVTLGAWVRRIHVGPVYVYTLSVAAWVLIAAAAALAFAW